MASSSDEFQSQHDNSGGAPADGQPKQLQVIVIAI